MKIAATIAKVLTALATIAGIVYIIATYGDKIVAWAKNLLGKFSCCECDGCECNCDGECTCECECDDCDCCDCECDECECEEEAEEAPAEEAAEEPAAEEADFEG
jgi:hypothetical protein